ncbi:MAG: hypothetical protein AMXMBFR84_13650 [Candidatus Hydrogenedentota bacterium]
MPWAWPQPTEVSRARDKVLQAEKVYAEAVEAQATNDFELATKKSEQARALLEEARGYFEKADVESHGTPEEAVDYVRLLNRLGDFDLAEKVLIPVLQRYPDKGELWLALGQVLSGMGEKRFGDAIQALQRATETVAEDSASSTAFASLGLQYFRQNLYDMAVESANKALEFNPNQSAAKMILAGIDLRNGKVVEAAAVFDQQSENPQAIAAIQVILPQALEAFDTVRQWFPDTAENHFAFARLLIRANRMQECAMALERSLQLDPSNYMAWNMAGGVYHQLNQIDRAIAAYRKSLEIKPDQDRTRQVIQQLEGQARQPSAQPNLP